MTQFRQTALLAAIAGTLIAGATAANAQTTVITREPVQTQTIVTERPLQLTPVQRRIIYRTIVQERVRPAQPTIEYRIGMPAPQIAPIYTVPETVAVEVPTVKSYKYMMVNNRVVLIDPSTSQVVEEIVD